MVESWSNSRLAAAIRALAVAEPSSAASQPIPAWPVSGSSARGGPGARRRVAAHEPQRGHRRGPVQDAARLQRVPLAAARSAAIRRWPCRSAEAAPGTDPSRDAQKATSTKSRIASRESAVEAERGGAHGEERGGPVHRLLVVRFRTSDR